MKVKDLDDLMGCQNKKRPKKVFVVHGHNVGHRQAVCELLSDLKLEPIVLEEQAWGGKTIVEKFEKHSEVPYAIVLLSADDKGGERHHDPTTYKLRARQNVILELGYFWGKLGRDHVCALVESGVEIPTDYDGVGFVYFDNIDWRKALTQEIVNAGIISRP